MNTKRILPLALSLALTASLLVAPVSAVTFSDVTDPKMVTATDLLYDLGIVSGTGGGLFLPGGSFTRAEFCKMALTAMGRGGEAALQSGRVIFSDVTSGWALGYVNAAATAPNETTPPLMRGKGNSLFEPIAPITYGEAVTVLMRTLGYSDADVALSGIWYEGYLAQAKAIGLTKGVERGGTDPITRGEAALLFQNLLYANTKVEQKPFLTVKLGGTITEEVLVLSVTATTPDGAKNAIKTPAKTYKTKHTAFDASYRGTRSKLVLDKNENVLAILPDTNITTRTVRITAEPQARYIKTENDETIIIPTTTPVWQADKEASTYDKTYMSIKLGTLLALAYDSAGNLDYLYILGEGYTTTSMVAKSTSAANPFSAITGGDTDFTVFKNGSPAKLSDVREYDVGTYNVNASTLTLSDRRLTGVYDNASPSTASPSTVTVMGHPFPVLDCALESLAKFTVGSPITLLLTGENQIAGAVSPTVLTGSAIGVAVVTVTTVVPDPASGSESYDLANATVTLTSGIEVTGTVDMGRGIAKDISGKLVNVSSSKLGTLTLRTASSESTSSAWDVKKGTIGSLKLAMGATIYERVGNSKLFPVALKDITRSSVPAKSITYVGKNSSGEVDLLVLENVTGDHFSYGFPVRGIGASENSTISVENNAKENPAFITGIDFALQVKNRQPIGIAPSLDVVGSTPRLSSWTPLTAVSGIRRAAFSETTVTIDGKEFPLASDLDAHCYNATAKSFFATLNDAKAYSTRMTVYFDRPANEGGKIRMVIVE